MDIYDKADFRHKEIYRGQEVKELRVHFGLSRKVLSVELRIHETHLGLLERECNSKYVPEKYTAQLNEIFSSISSDLVANRKLLKDLKRDTPDQDIHDFFSQLRAKLSPGVKLEAMTNDELLALRDQIKSSFSEIDAEIVKRLKAKQG